ncbi:MAG: hypothetical protein HC859_00490 [Bacteroidia bacterium]|nr:hypothetical protein [Bacteroidia bacterium]
MGLLGRIAKSNFFVRLFSWEYWPFGIIQFPFFLYWLWLSAKARSLFFFSASNPGILSGGMMGESKFSVLQKIPDAFKPRAILLPPGIAISELESRLRQDGLSYPLIFKPDLGERGWMVKRINNRDDAATYIRDIHIDFIAQALVDMPLEFGVYYARHPDATRGTVTSIVGKEMLAVTGDGSATLQQLILSKDRARLQWDTLKATYAGRLNDVLPPGQKLELVSIGNHCLGTTFLDATALITPRLVDSFDMISKQIDGFYYGRFDLRTQSLEDLQAGRVQVMELNGCGAEPAHIYQPGYPLFKGLRAMYHHWHTLYQISVANHRKGVPYLSFREGLSIYKRAKSLMRD